MALTKFLCWAFWMVCNKAIFKGVHPISTSMTTKEMHFPFEYISTCGYDPHELVDISQGKKDWLWIGQNPYQAGSFIYKPPTWKSFVIRMDPEDIIKWRNNKRKCSFFLMEHQKETQGRKEQEGLYIYSMNKLRYNMHGALEVLQIIKLHF